MAGLFFALPDSAAAQQNVLQLRDTISDSAPSSTANHTFAFTLQTDVAPGGSFTFTPPVDFSITELADATATSGAFTTRNIELYVNNVLRSATSSLSAFTDQVVITSGTPGSITYTLNTTTGVNAGDQLEFRMGGHASGSLPARSVTVGTTTVNYPADSSGIRNGSATGTQFINMAVTGSVEPVQGDFVIAIIDPVTAGPADTTEEIPPFRFGGAPTGTVSGTTLNVEISLRTDEFAACSFSTVASTTYAAMTNDFDSSGLIVHSAVVATVPNTAYTFYVRCIDDEGNINIDDYIIAFSTLDPPDGTSNPDGSDGGDGSGPNDSGSGGGSGTGNGSGSSGTGGGNSNSSSGGGGGGGGSGTTDGGNPPGGFENGSPYESGDGQVFINGYAFPGSRVTLLVDGQRAESAVARNDGSFALEVDEIARGVYTFGVYAEDDNGVLSSTFSTSFTVSGARATRLSNINIAPSVAVVPDPVELGGVAVIEGYALPNASITIESQGENGGSPLTLLTTSDDDGFYQTELDASGFARGTYQIRAQAEQTDGIATDFSNWKFYGVGEEAAAPINADLNRDGSVNLTDFSILLFWWGTDGGASDPPADINQDGNTNLTDFSILLFNWTG